ncbi:hypothetical protein ERO13_1Z049443v2 [Gossypium hirsutum]|nr:hypothetical protein ERO13_1Z049443v2 [Gossypium hirsutum]
MFAERSKKGISDNKIYHYHLNLGGSVSTRRLTRLPSIPKNDAKFRGYVGIHSSGFRNFLLKLELL